MTRKERIQLRNDKVRKYFAELEKKHPQWKLSALLEDTAHQFPPISPATVSAILKYSGSYADDI
ncbi:hypothetical protein [Chryseobacterium salviniae]|uniref:Uncharacterized protein n=1 Tax=Chryseobacterium salviniae TaxID=3101750 RepID=A0ABU6HTZ8_9FLAO|nr:hypothetical protein [Chryseobacterium sp. T9W2-O]MEC3875952.1 hypothetical protein [Chryseobacterium sp. T9W2-O]